MPKVLDDCVASLEAKGMPKDQAFPICRSRLKLNEHITPEEIEDMVSEFKKHPEPVFKDIKGVEIFATGTHNGDKFTNKDLDGIVDAFEKTKDFLNPFVKIGHNDRQNLLAADEMPNAGLIENVKRVGNKLIADFKRVPKKIFDIISQGLFRKISAELFVNFNSGKEVHPLALKAVAVLGGETPAIRNLQDILDLGFYMNTAHVAYKTDSEVREYIFAQNLNKKEDTEMSEELVRQNEKLQAEIKSFKEENASLEKDLDTLEISSKESEDKVKTLSEDNTKMKEVIKQSEVDTRNKEIDTTVDKFASEEKILPAQGKILKELLRKVEGDIDKQIYAFIEAGNVDINTGQQSNNVGGGKDITNEVIEKYAKDHKLSFKEAYIELSDENKGE